MAKCPYCKQSLTLGDTKRESADVTEEVHRDVSGSDSGSSSAVC
jgi:hypothetical protein